MDGVLEAVLTLCVCKMACSMLCLPAVRASLSSVSLCCSSLLLFTDFAITTFLAFLWLAERWLPPFPVSDDVIALRFMLFLGQTYRAVLLLTAPLVAVEMALRLQRPRASGTEGVAGEGEGGESSARLGPVGVQIESCGTDSPRRGSECRSVPPAHALSFLCCLLVWCVSGVRGGQGWGLEELSTKACLESGSSLALCLPSLLTATLPALSEPVWGLLAVALPLGLAGGLGLLKLRQAHRLTRPQGPAASAPRQGEDSDAQQPTQTQPALCATMNPAAVASQAHAVDTGKTAHMCSIHSTESENDEQPGLDPHGNPVLLAHLFTAEDGFKLTNDSAMLFASGLPQKHTHHQHNTMELDVRDLAHPASSIRRAQHPHRRGFWLTQWGSPSLGGSVLAGLVCGLLVCVFPLVFSANILLISSLESLLVCILKLLLSISHSTYTNERLLGVDVMEDCKRGGRGRGEEERWDDGEDRKRVKS